jgi:hypothetical protein
MKEMSEGLSPQNWPRKLISEGKMDDSKKAWASSTYSLYEAGDPSHALSHNLLIFLYIYWRIANIEDDKKNF